MMSWIERVIRLAMPTLVLEGSPWKSEWEATQRVRFVRVARVFFLVVGMAYLAHYFFFDRPRGLEPSRYWLIFRLAAFSLCMSCYLFYTSSFAASKWYRAPAVIVCIAACYSQAVVTLAYPDAPWIYPFVFVFACVLILQLNSLQSVFFSACAISLVYPPLLAAGVEADTLTSATIVTVILASAARSGYAFEVNNFLLSKEKDEQGKEIINLQQDFTDRLKSFIPRVIANRIQTLVDHDRMSVMEASIDVLAARKKVVACLFSDIRGFTEGSKDLDQYVLASVVPEVKASTEAIEAFEGIPRKVGDLIFAYFDAAPIELNLVRATLAGMSLAQLNEDMNATVSSVDIKRHILVSSGPAIVGNLGGVDSAVEITALGSPVNFLSRLDEATKDPRLLPELKEGDVLMCPASARRLLDLDLGIRYRKIDLVDLGINIRDFHEVDSVYAVPTDELNIRALSDANQRMSLLNEPPFHWTEMASSSAA